MFIGNLGAMTTARPGNEPFFSIITAVFNGARTLQAAIDSLDRQTFRNFEHIVLDGASTDGTVQILEQNSSRIQHWTSEPDSGVYDAWNKGLARARGEWISFLGADDIYFPDALEAYARWIAIQPRKDLQYVSSRVELEKDGTVMRAIGRPWSWPGFSRYMSVAHVGSMHHRRLYEQYGRYDESYRSCADYELLLRPRERLQAGFFRQVTARMALGGLSNANVRLALAEQERAKRTTGKRTAWRCRLERRTAYFRDRCRSMLWY
jgi:glycosyltransferase involved in cell wall biosynthesis